ncbi:diguanylate cyclase [Oceanobacillus massiliensis]|uniref:diguanylate cyclase n=1 Tax=Oceanobacillus massiliensis TaxID=1465765 RepID=UPI0011C8AF5C|nr:diguanylate cyclase [Oceanobacillus massiliensis]
MNLLSKPIEISGFLLASVLIMFILFVALFIGFRLTIGRDTLRYEVLLMRFPVYAKEISAGQIKKIHFKRVNWSTKAAVVQLEKGMNLHIRGFTPKAAYDHLMEFAESKDLPISKTRDYRILEKMR